MKVILAIGSPFGADRIGWQLAENLQQQGVENIHTCRHPIDLLPYFNDNPDCIVIDALWARGKPGELMEIHPADLKKEFCRNSHDLTLFEVIQLAGIAEQLPEHLTIYGIEINQHSTSVFSEHEVMQLSQELVQQLELKVEQFNSL